MRGVFKSVLVIHEVHRRDALPERARGYRVDSLTLGWEERLRARARRRSDQGFEFGAALPRGTVLRSGDCFIVDSERLVVEVIEQDEQVLIVEPQTPSQWGLFAYQIGNCHQPVMITDREIVCIDTLGLDETLRLYGIPFVRSVRPFTPVGVGDEISADSHRHLFRS